MFDTNVLVSAIFWNGASSRLLDLAIAGRVVLVSSPQILDEFATVLVRDFDYSKEDASKAAGAFFQISELVRPATHCKIIKEDPADDKILECAIDGCAEFIATYDKHLLKWREIHGIKMLKPEAILRELETSND